MRLHANRGRKNYRPIKTDAAFRYGKSFFAFIAVALLASAALLANAAGEILPYQDPKQPLDARIDDPARHRIDVQALATVAAVALPPLGAALDQSALYVMLTRDAVGALGGDPEVDSDRVLLITTPQRTMTFHRAK